MANFNWDTETIFEMKGKVLEVLMNYAEIEVKKAQGIPVNKFERLDLLRATNAALQEIFSDGIKQGLITEMVVEEKAEPKRKKK